MDTERLLDVLARLWPALPLGIVGAGLCIAALALQWQFRHRQELVQVQATVVHVGAETSTRSANGHYSWSVRALCNYDWAGELHKGKEILLTGGSVNSQREMEALLAAHPAGSVLPLWIHPRTPSLPMAELPTQTQVMVLGTIGGIFLAAAAGFFFSAGE